MRKKISKALGVLIGFRRKKLSPFACLLFFTVSLLVLDERIFPYYEPGDNAASLATARGGSASGSAHYTFINPALLSFASDGISLSAGYRRFFVGMNISSYLSEDVPGYIAPNIDEKNLEAFYRFPKNFSAGFGFYSMDLVGSFSHKIIAFYASWSLDDFVSVSDKESFSVGFSLKNIGLSYNPDDYTAEFFSKYSPEKNTLTYDCGVFYSYRIFGFALVGRNLYPGSSLGIYERDNSPLVSEFIVGGSVALGGRFDLRLDARTSGRAGFTDAIPSFVWRVGESFFLMAGANSSQVAAGVSVGFGDFNLTTAFIYPYSISDGFGDAAVSCGWRFGAVQRD